MISKTAVQTHTLAYSLPNREMTYGLILKSKLHHSLENLIGLKIISTESKQKGKTSLPFMNHSLVVLKPLLHKPTHTNI